MNNRIAEVRKHFGLTQAEFGAKIGLSRDGVASYERGNAKPTGVALQCIASVFHVNRYWLETGEGEMLADSSANDPLDELCNQYKLSAMSRGIVKGFVELSEDQRAFFLQIARQVLESGAESADAELGEAVESASSEIIKEKHA